MLENNVWTSDTLGGLEDQPHPVEPLCIGGDDEIGDAKDAFRDSQENLAEGEFVGCPNSCDEISDDSFSDGEAREALDEELHEMLGWPLELLHAPDRGKKHVRRNQKSLPNQYEYEQYMGEDGEHDQDQRRSMAGPSGIASTFALGDGIGQGGGQSDEPWAWEQGDRTPPPLDPLFTTHAENGYYEIQYHSSDLQTSIRQRPAHPASRVQREVRPPRTICMEQLSDVESEDLGDEIDDGEGDSNNPGSIKHRYRSSKLRQIDNTYDPPRMVFQGFGGPIKKWNRMPSFQTLFEMFWTTAMLLNIVAETNGYARAIDRARKLPGGENWKDLTLPEFKVFLAITLYMGMRKQPNVKSYWMKSPSIFHCSIISNLLSRGRFMVLTKCFHLANHDTYVRDRDLPGYDKMGQVRGISDQVRETFRNCWNLEKFLTIDEMMIRYKGTYCPTRQYMPKNHKMEDKGLVFGRFQR